MHYPQNENETFVYGLGYIIVHAFAYLFLALAGFFVSAAEYAEENPEEFELGFAAIAIALLLMSPLLFTIAIIFKL